MFQREGMLGPERHAQQGHRSQDLTHQCLSGFRTPCTFKFSGFNTCLSNLPLLWYLWLKTSLLILIIAPQYHSVGKALGLVLHMPQHIVQSKEGELLWLAEILRHPIEVGCWLHTTTLRGRRQQGKLLEEHGAKVDSYNHTHGRKDMCYSESSMRTANETSFSPVTHNCQTPISTSPQKTVITSLLCCPFLFERRPPTLWELPALAQGCPQCGAQSSRQVPAVVHAVWSTVPCVHRHTCTISGSVCTKSQH